MKTGGGLAEKHAAKQESAEAFCQRKDAFKDVVKKSDSDNIYFFGQSCHEKLKDECTKIDVRISKELDTDWRNSIIDACKIVEESAPGVGLICSDFIKLKKEEIHPGMII